MTEDIYSTIEEYWSNSMSDAQREQFEQKLKADQAFASEVRLYLETKAAAALLAKEKLKEKLLQLGDEILKEESLRQSPLT